MTDFPKDQVIEVLSDEGSEQSLADVFSTSFGEEEEDKEDEDAGGEEGGDSNEQFEESEEDPTDRATLKEILAEVAAPSSTFFRRLSSVAKGKRVVDPPMSSPVHDQSLLEIFLDNQPAPPQVLFLIEPLSYAPLIISCPIYQPFLPIPKELLWPLYFFSRPCFPQWLDQLKCWPLPTWRGE